MHALDVEAFEWVARLDTPPLDQVLPRLSTAASYSRLWIGIALALAVRGGRARRTAIAAMAAVGVTSALANLLVKMVAKRRRPTSEVPEARRLEQPASTSFPSGHAASAAAFSGVVGHQFPALWLPVNALAGSVAFSRVYTGVHYPGDVVIGWLLGKSVASATNRVMRRRPAER
jgi:undecaprenyl-diphosphatase